MFDSKSRYAKLTPWTATDRRGRTVSVVPPAPAREEELLGYHVRKDGQRLDLLASRYLDDPTAWWRICELADVMLPEALALEDEIPIPRKA